MMKSEIHESEHLLLIVYYQSYLGYVITDNSFLLRQKILKSLWKFLQDMTVGTGYCGWLYINYVKFISLPDEGYLVWSNCNEAEGKHVRPFRPNVLVTFIQCYKKYFPTCNIIRPLIFLSSSIYEA